MRAYRALAVRDAPSRLAGDVFKVDGPNGGCGCLFVNGALGELFHGMVHVIPFDARDKTAPHDEHVTLACRIKDVSGLRTDGRKAALLHDTVRLGILEEVVGVDGPSAQGIASVVDEALKSLGGEAMTPIGNADPIADGILVVCLEIIAGIAC